MKFGAFLILIIFTILPSLNSAQEVFYEVEQSGINFGYTSFSSKYTSGAGLKLSITLSGSYILYTNYIKSKYSSTNPELDDGKSESLDGGFALLLPSSILEKFPTYYSLLFIDYGKLKFLTGELSGNSSNVLSFGASFNKKLNHKNDFQVMPFFKVGHIFVSTKSKISRSYFKKLHNHYYFGAGINLGYLGNHLIWPAANIFFNYADDIMTYGLTVSLSIGNLKRKKYL
jgi:hypothetical protein